MGWLAAFHIVPEGLAAPYAASIGEGATAVGLLMAAAPAGSALGAFLIVRLPEARRIRSIGLLAIAAGLPLIACASKPSLGVSIALWATCGLFSGYQVQAGASFVRAVPNRLRGQTIGLASSGMLAIQGVGVLVFGLVASHLDAASSIAIAGLVATVLAVLLAASWAHTLRTSVPTVEGGDVSSETEPDQVDNETAASQSSRRDAS
jgi:MFS family permease